MWLRVAPVPHAHISDQSTVGTEVLGCSPTGEGVLWPSLQAVIYDPATRPKSTVDIIDKSVQRTWLVFEPLCKDHQSINQPTRHR